MKTILKLKNIIICVAVCCVCQFAKAQNQGAIALVSGMAGASAGTIYTLSTDLNTLAGIQSSGVVTVLQLDGTMYTGGTLGAALQVAGYAAPEITVVVVGVGADIDLIINAGNAAVDAWNALTVEEQTADALAASTAAIATAVSNAAAYQAAYMYALSLGADSDIANEFAMGGLDEDQLEQWLQNHSNRSLN